MMASIGTVTLFGFEGYQILAFSGAWMKILGNGTFDVAIVNGKLQITSSQKIKR